MKQLGLTDARLVKRSKRTRKEQFLGEMNAIISWQRLIATIEPHYPKATRGRRRVPLETMLRIHLLQHFFRKKIHSRYFRVWDSPPEENLLTDIF